MAAPNSVTALQRAFYTIGTLALVTAVLYWGKVVLIPLALAVLLAFVLTPLVQRLERRHNLRRPASVSIVALGAFAVLGGVLFLAGHEISILADEMRKDR